MKRFCPKCGNEADELIGKICKDCFSQSAALIEVPKRIRIETCKTCKKTRISGRWFDKNDALLKELVLKNLNFGTFKAEEICLDFHPDEDGYNISIKARLSKGNSFFEGNAETRISEQIVMCDSCMKLISNYYEGTIQIRGFKDNEQIIEEIRKFLGGTRKGDMLAGITAIDRKREGIDVKIGSKRAAKKTAKHLVDKYGASSLSSFSIAGFDRMKQRSKKRVTYCIRPKGE